MTNRLKAIQALKDQMPVANQQLAKQYRSANDFLLQQQVSQAPSQAPTNQASAQIAGQQATQAGQQTAQLNQLQSEQGQQLAGAAVSEQNIVNQTSNRDAQRVNREADFAGQQRLAALGEDVRQELHDSRQTIVNDQQNFRFFNQRQLADWAIARGISDEQFRDYQQAEQQAVQRKLEMLDHAQAVIRQELQNESTLNNQNKQQELQIHLQNLQKKQQETLAKKQQFARVVSGVLGVVGAGAGAIAGGPGGAAIGASIGSGAGSAASGFFG